MDKIPMTKNGMIHEVLVKDVERFTNAGWQTANTSEPASSEAGKEVDAVETKRRGRRKKV